MLVSDPKELERIRQREVDITGERIAKIIAAGANVILTSKGIDDTALKYFVEAGAIACRRVPKDDLRCAAVCGAVLVSPTSTHPSPGPPTHPFPPPTHTGAWPRPPAPRL